MPNSPNHRSPPGVADLSHLPLTARPLAAAGLISYRCRGPYGWVMIGAISDSDAMNEARRSCSSPPRVEDLEVWNGTQYIPVQAGFQEKAA